MRRGPNDIVIERKAKRMTVRAARKSMRLLATSPASVSASASASSATSAAAGGDPNESPEERTARLRSMVIDELVDTERRYLEDLYTLMIFYITPIRMHFASEPPTSNEWTNLFGQFNTVEQIFDLNTDFSAELTEHIKADPATCIGQTFVPFSARLECYSTFCNRQEEALETVSALTSKNSQFKQLLQRCRSSTRSQLDFVDLLVKPFQRVLKYPLLLREALKYTPPTHPDYAGTAEAIRCMERTIAEINSSKTHSDNLKKILSINSQIISSTKDVSLVHPSRKFVLEGILSKLEHTTTQPRHCILFSDVLVYCKEKSPGKLVLCGLAPLLRITVEDLPDSTQLANAIRVVKRDVSFGIGHDSATILCCPTKEEKAKWLKAIQQTTADLVAEQQATQKKNSPAAATAAEQNSAAPTRKQIKSSVSAIVAKKRQTILFSKGVDFSGPQSPRSSTSPPSQSHTQAALALRKEMAAVLPRLPGSNAIHKPMPAQPPPRPPSAQLPQQATGFKKATPKETSATVMILGSPRDETSRLSMQSDHSPRASVQSTASSSSSGVRASISGTVAGIDDDDTDYDDDFGDEDEDEGGEDDQADGDEDDEEYVRFLMDTPALATQRSLDSKAAATAQRPKVPSSASPPISAVPHQQGRLSGEGVLPVGTRSIQGHVLPQNPPPPPPMPARARPAFSKSQSQSALPQPPAQSQSPAQLVSSPQAASQSQPQSQCQSQTQSQGSAPRRPLPEMKARRRSASLGTLVGAHSAVPAGAEAVATSQRMPASAHTSPPPLPRSQPQAAPAMAQPQSAKAKPSPPPRPPERVTPMHPSAPVAPSSIAVGGGGGVPKPLPALPRQRQPTGKLFS